LIAYSCRYHNLFTAFFSIYNSIMKIFYLGATTLLVVILLPCSKHAAKETYQDIEFSSGIRILVSCLAVTCAIRYYEVGALGEDLSADVWTFSILLEPVALLPQIIMFRKYREIENLSGGSFIALMGLYRFLDIVDAIMNTPVDHINWIAYLSGITHVFICFFGLFAQEESTSSAPLLPQLIQFVKACHRGKVLFWGLSLSFLPCLNPFLCQYSY